MAEKGKRGEKMPANPPESEMPRTEKEIVAERIAEKARKLNKEIEIKWRSLPFRVGRELEEKAESLGSKLVWKSPCKKDRGAIGFKYTISNYSGFSIALKGEFFKDPEQKDNPIVCCFLSKDWSVLRLFNLSGEDWIRLAVFLEDAIEKMETELERFYHKYLSKLSSDELDLMRKLKSSIVEVEQLREQEKQNKKYLNLLQKTIDFLKTTKGICKSKEIKRFREYLEDELVNLEREESRQPLSSIPSLQNRTVSIPPPPVPPRIPDLIEGRKRPVPDGQIPNPPPPVLRP